MRGHVVEHAEERLLQILALSIAPVSLIAIHVPDSSIKRFADPVLW